MAKRAIYKYKLEDNKPHLIPGGITARFLTAQIQNGVLCVWVMVSPGEMEQPVKFRAFGTGELFDDADINDAQLMYLATVQTPPLVWHVFYQAAP